VRPEEGPLRRREHPGTRALCACGLSGLLPFCDGNHLGTGIEPIMVEITKEQEVAWCLCRRSADFPLCDDSCAR
jgi:CDGSH-type Zn-finger protein